MSIVCCAASGKKDTHLGDNDLIGNKVQIILGGSQLGGGSSLVLLENGDSLIDGILDHNVSLKGKRY
jgi:hypothetical protein